MYKSVNLSQVRQHGCPRATSIVSLLWFRGLHVPGNDTTDPNQKTRGCDQMVAASCTDSEGSLINLVGFLGRTCYGTCMNLQPKTTLKSQLAIIDCQQVCPERFRHASLLSCPDFSVCKNFGLMLVALMRTQ